MNWKLILAEGQTPSVSWRQSLTDDGSGLQANKLASSMTNPDNISNYEDVGGMGSVNGVSGNTDIEAGDLKSLMEEAYAEILKYQKSAGKVGKDIDDAIGWVPSSKVTGTLALMNNGGNSGSANGTSFKFPGYTQQLIDICKKQKIDPMLIAAFIVIESEGRVNRLGGTNPPGKGLMQITSSSHPPAWNNNSNATQVIDLEINKGISMIKGKMSNGGNPFYWITAYNGIVGTVLKNASSYIEFQKAITSTSYNRNYFAKICIAYNLLLKASGSNVLVTAQGSTTEYCKPVKSATVTSPYGYRKHPITKERKFHSGVDLANSTGTPIYAIATGTVTLAGTNGGYGNCIIITHSSTLKGQIQKTLYGHLSKINVKKGQSVSKGNLIGLMGSSGFSTGSHLHFECQKNTGTSVNPTVLYPNIVNEQQFK